MPHCNSFTFPYLWQYCNYKLRYAMGVSVESRIFYSTKCFNLSENNDCVIYPRTIYLGGRRNYSWKLYLYFEVDAIPSEAIIESASIVLYETMEGVHIDKELYQIFITPTYDYLNPYFGSYYYTTEALGEQLFYTAVSSNHLVKIHVERLIHNWVSRRISNYGCMIELAPHSELRAFTGLSLEATRPFLKVTYRLPTGKILYYYDDSVKLPAQAKKIEKV